MKCITLLWISLAFISAQDDDPIVETKYGTVSGKEIILDDGTVINSFLGIPFAKPQEDELRFEPPQEPDPWTDVFPADDLGDACMQSLASTVQLSHLGWTRFSEDCLHLNIYSPQRENPEDLLPVMVWIHGGGYQGGANFIYPGYFLARKDVVVVTVNYRLGIMGFAMTEDGTIQGNMGLLDQILALTFVQENIQAFGGDKNQVTIFGESAGAGSVGLLMMSPLSQGLFHGSMLQSGCELAQFAINRPISNPEHCLQDIATQFNCSIETTEEMVGCLREVNRRSLINARCDCPEGQWCNFDPIIDGSIIPDTPRNLRERGEYMQVPEVIGVNDDDSFLFVAGEYPSLIRNGLNRSMFDEIIWEDVYDASVHWPDPSRAEDVFKAIQFFYADWPYYDDPIRNRDMLGKLSTDEGFGYAADYQAKLHSMDNLPVYFYVYDYVPEQYFFPDWMGAFHGTELILEFGWPFIFAEGNEMALNHSQTSDVGALNLTAADAEYSDYMMTLWTNFAKYGNPTPDPVLGPDNTQVVWPQFIQGNLYYLHLQPSPEVQMDYRQQEYAFWTEYLQYLIYGTEFTDHEFQQFNFLPQLHTSSDDDDEDFFIDL